MEPMKVFLMETTRVQMMELKTDLKTVSKEILTGMLTSKALVMGALCKIRLKM